MVQSTALTGQGSLVRIQYDSQRGCLKRQSFFCKISSYFVYCNMSKKQRKATFKPYNPDQLSLLPPSLDELIAENHVVRLVRSIIDKLNIDSILKKYKGGGSSSYHPKMMLKIIIYGYLSNIYSSRKIEQAVQSNIHFMWLSGMQRPDHNTINRCLLYTSPSPRDRQKSRMPSSA